MIIVSDVHSNLPALLKVLEFVKEGERIFHAGDVVGYNPYPGEVIKKFREYRIQSIRGNHDRAIVYSDYSNFNEIAYYALKWTEENLSKEDIDYLKSLKKSMSFEFKNKRVIMFHGSPWDEDLYLYPEDVDEKTIPDGYQVLILGHTHIPFVKKFGDKIIINPGSVGQPRDGDPRASFARIDDEWNVEIVRVDYNIDEVAEKIKEKNLPSILAERLYLGF